MFARVSFSLIARRFCSRAITRVRPVGLDMNPFNPTAHARPFHASLSLRSNCDWGYACDCSECQEAFRKSTCQSCRVRPATIHASKWCWDSESGGYYDFTSHCQQCLDKAAEEERQREWEERQRKLEEQQKLAARRAKMEKMMDHVRGIRSSQTVPIAYAIYKYVNDIKSAETRHLETSPSRFHQRLLNLFSEELRIRKIKHKYVCSKEAVDAMDFKLWHYWSDLCFDVGA